MHNGITYYTGSVAGIEAGRVEEGDICTAQELLISECINMEFSSTWKYSLRLHITCSDKVTESMIEFSSVRNEGKKWTLKVSLGFGRPFRAQMRDVSLTKVQ